MKTDLSQQCLHVAQKETASWVAGRGNASRMKEVILSFCYTIVRPDQKYCIHVWGTQHKKYRNMLKQAQRMPQRKSEGWRTSPRKQDDRNGIVQFGEYKALEKP